MAINLSTLTTSWSEELGGFEDDFERKLHEIADYCKEAGIDIGVRLDGNRRKILEKKRVVPKVAKDYKGEVLFYYEGAHDLMNVDSSVVRSLIMGNNELLKIYGDGRGIIAPPVRFTLAHNLAQNGELKESDYKKIEERMCALDNLAGGWKGRIVYEPLDLSIEQTERVLKDMKGKKNSLLLCDPINYFVGLLHERDGGYVPPTSGKVVEFVMDNLDKIGMFHIKYAREGQIGPDINPPNINPYLENDLNFRNLLEKLDGCYDGIVAMELMPGSNTRGRIDSTMHHLRPRRDVL